MGRYIDIQKSETIPTPTVGDSYGEVYPWYGTYSVTLGWTKVRNLSESEALTMAFTRVPDAIVKSSVGMTVAKAATLPTPRHGWEDRVLVIAYETASSLFAIGVCNGQWELLSRPKALSSSGKLDKSKFCRRTQQ